MQIKVSVIIAVKNAAGTIARAIDSLIGQSYKSLEIIAIDGASTDGTREILDEYKQHFTHFISEPDQGLADGWNKGLERASGAIIGFLSGDDFYEADAVANAVRALNPEEMELSYGTTRLFGGGHDLQEIVGLFHRKNIERRFDFYFTSCFFTKKCVESVGAFNTEVRIAVDTDWLLRALRAGVSFKPSRTVVYMARGGMSDVQFMRAYKEYVSSLIRCGYVNQQRARFLIGRERLFMGLRRLLGARRVGQIKTLSYMSVLAFVNVMLRYAPTFVLRRSILKAVGAKIAPTSTVHRGLRLMGFGPLSVGPLTTINRYCELDPRGGLTIGANVTISQNCSIFSLGHDASDPSYRLISKAVSIENHAVIFPRSLIMPGVTVAIGAVIYPGAVVTRPCAPWSIYGGNPAQLIRRRNLDANEIRYESRFPVWLG